MVRTWVRDKEIQTPEIFRSKVFGNKKNEILEGFRPSSYSKKCLQTVFSDFRDGLAISVSEFRGRPSTLES